MSLSKISPAVFLLLLAMPIAFAFNCNCFAGVEMENCFEISQLSLSEDEKSQLYADLIYGSSSYAYFKVIRDWNLAQTLVKSDTAKIASGEFAKNVWLDQFAVMPSVMDGSTLYVPKDVEVLAGFGYEISVPKDYYSGGYPKTSYGDCRREYRLKGNTAKIEVFADGQLQGSGTLVSTAIKKDSVIESRLSIDVSVEIDHYKWNTYCCSYDESGCAKYCHKCKFDDDETKTDRIRLTDLAQVKLYDVTPVIELEINDAYYGTTKGKVRASNYSAFELKFEDSSLKRTAYLYEAVLNGSPNYIATLRAKPHESQTLKNIYLENNTFYVKNTGICKIISKNHFNTFEQECEFISNPTKELEEFKLQKFNGDLYFAFGLCIFIFVNYLICKVIIRYWGRFK